MKLNKLTFTSASHTDFTLDSLRQLVPSAFTEVRDANGQLNHKIDFDVLRELLGDAILDTEGDRFGFYWVGKQDAKRAAAEPIHKTLRPIIEDSVDWDTTENLYIEGDNLDALKLLQRAYLGKVKMIYIDPPYNTGNDFVYQDNFSMTKEELDEATGNVDEEGYRLRSNPKTHQRYHSDWCSMMYSRLLVARTLLANDGVIFISIDDNEVHHLRKICDEVFGVNNFLGTISVINNLKGRSDDNFFATANEFFLAYSRNIEYLVIGGFKITEEEVENDYDKSDEISYYKLVGLRKTGNAWRREERPKMFYPILEKDGFFFTISVSEYEDLYDETSKQFNDEFINELSDKYRSLGYNIIWPKTENGEFGRWRWGIDNFIEQKDFNIELNSNGSVCSKMRATLENGSVRLKSAKTIWYKPEYDTGSSSKILKSLFGSSDIFNNPKSLVYLSDLITISTELDSLILDFFSGSATTAHAVMQLNAEDGGNRKYICVQLPEETPEKSEARKAGYSTICEIGKERIRRAGKKIKEAPENKDKEIDTGFRVLRVDSSNMEDIYYEPTSLSQENLFTQIDSVKNDRTELDLLFGCMVDWGVELSYPLRTEQVAGKTLHVVNEGALVACFDRDIDSNSEVVHYIAKMKPLRIIFHEVCFTTDADKLNIYEQFKQLCGWNDDEAYKRIYVI